MVAENKNLVVVVVVVVVVGESIGGNFSRWGNEEIFSQWGDSPSKEALLTVVLLPSWYLQHWKIYF